MKTSYIIAQMRDILSGSSWGPGPLARDQYSYEVTYNVVDPLSDDAVCWSVEGACIKAVGGDKTAWDRVKKCILAFRPPLGADGKPVTFEQVEALLAGAYYYAYLQEMDPNEKTEPVKKVDKWGRKV